MSDGISTTNHPPNIPLARQAVTYHRSRPVAATGPRSLDVSDRSPTGYTVARPRSRRMRDLLSVVRERIASPVLKTVYPELANMGFDLVSKEWTLSLPRQRNTCAKMLGGLEGRTVLVLGCGFGDDACAWAAHHPKRVIAADLVNYATCWERCAAQASREGTALEFIQSDLAKPSWAFVDAESVDVISSYAVLEHISDLASLMAASARTLRSGGLFVATYGPLWFGPNGDHTFPRSEDDYYNHLRFDDAEYAEYIRRTETEWRHQGNACEGPFLLERALFSYLRVDEYLKIFRNAGFEVVLSLANISSAATRYRRRHPDIWSRLKDTRGLRDGDLLCNGSTVLLRKRAH